MRSLPKIESRLRHSYNDDCHRLDAATVKAMLELHGRNVGTTLSNQYVSQLVPELPEAVLGMVGVLVPFRLRSTDAGLLEAQFSADQNRRRHIDLPLYAAPTP